MRPPAAHQLHYDWVGSNWYLLLPAERLVLICSSQMTICRPLMDLDAEPVAMVVDILNRSVWRDRDGWGRRWRDG